MLGPLQQPRSHVNPRHNWIFGDPGLPLALLSELSQKWAGVQTIPDSSAKSVKVGPSPNNFGPFAINRQPSDAFPLYHGLPLTGESQRRQVLSAFLIAAIESDLLTPPDHSNSPPDLVAPLTLATIKAYVDDSELLVAAEPDSILGGVHCIAIHHRAIPPRRDGLTLIVVATQAPL